MRLSPSTFSSPPLPFQRSGTNVLPPSLPPSPLIHSPFTTPPRNLRKFSFFSPPVLLSRAPGCLQFCFPFFRQISPPGNAGRVFRSPDPRALIFIIAPLRRGKCSLAGPYLGSSASSDRGQYLKDFGWLLSTSTVQYWH